MKYVLNIAPKPQSRPRFGNGRAYEKADMKQWKKHAAYLMKSKRPKKIEKGAIYLGLTFYIYPPKRISKIDNKKPVPNEIIETIYVDKKPDLDNYVKAIQDAANDILYKDDGQIAVSSTQKFYSLNPRIEIEIETLEENK